MSDTTNKFWFRFLPSEENIQRFESLYKTEHWLHNRIIELHNKYHNLDIEMRIKGILEDIRNEIKNIDQLDTNFFHEKHIQEKVESSERKFNAYWYGQKFKEKRKIRAEPSVPLPDDSHTQSLMVDCDPDNWQACYQYGEQINVPGIGEIENINWRLLPNDQPARFQVIRDHVEHQWRYNLVVIFKRNTSFRERHP
ncbi:MAG: hypothetical protein EP297_08510 [Gammaproteobacteria bacterium]|nr:MAG: hypothetical protein EP297_08510 [Gammaproteobacteria bacterium]